MSLYLLNLIESISQLINLYWASKIDMRDVIEEFALAAVLNKMLSKFLSK